MSSRWVLVAGAACAVAFGGCSTGGDLGKQCVLVRKDPTDTDRSDGLRSIAIKESEVTPGKDFISFGATECEDLVCVRVGSTPLTGDPNADATGKCSRPCLPTNESSCATGDESVDKGPNKFVCRPLLLDTETLAQIRQQDPAKYQQYFGDTQSPDFCAHPLSAE